MTVHTEMIPQRQILKVSVHRQLALGLLLVIALVAFELFNFDTTQYALADLLGDVRFVSLRWATILAIAFCAIDFAGLARLFMPEAEHGAPKETWYLMGAWLLGASMNALMTWWAVSLTLLNHELGNEVLSRAQLLEIVPIFVAILVWLTRILFIGALTSAGGHLFESDRVQPSRPVKLERPVDQPVQQASPTVEPAPTGGEIKGIFRRSGSGSQPQPVQTAFAQAPTSGQRSTSRYRAMRASSRH
jgi:hypothetical protein